MAINPTGTDIMTKVNASKAIFNGSIVMSVDKQGNIAVNHNIKNHAPGPLSVESLLSSRFDDPMYYSS
jgi:hypothetical protein